VTNDTFKAHKNGEVLPVPNLDDTAEFAPYPPGPLTLAEFQKRVAAWRKRAIPNATLDGQLVKLIDEAEELIDEGEWRSEIEHGASAMLKEAADVCIVACNVADLAGLSFADILLDKQARNEAKTWKEDGSGKAQHVEGDAP
jgi:NTP pyrophosphatase (non-canonical NTP hydrolase)